MTNEEFSIAVAKHVTQPPLNERVTFECDGHFSTKDDYSVMRFYSGDPPPDMPSDLTS